MQCPGLDTELEEKVILVCFDLFFVINDIIGNLERLYELGGGGLSMFLS